MIMSIVIEVSQVYKEVKKVSRDTNMSRLGLPKGICRKEKRKEFLIKVNDEVISGKEDEKVSMGLVEVLVIGVALLFAYCLYERRLI